MRYSHAEAVRLVRAARPMREWCLKHVDRRPGVYFITTVQRTPTLEGVAAWEWTTGRKWKVGCSRKDVLNRICTHASSLDFVDDLESCGVRPLKLHHVVYTSAEFAFAIEASAHAVLHRWRCGKRELFCVPSNVDRYSPDHPGNLRTRKDIGIALRYAATAAEVMA